MAKPWEKYGGGAPQATPTQQGPWSQYQATPIAMRPDTGEPQNRGTIGIVEELATQAPRQAGLAGRSIVQGLMAIPATVANIPANVYNESMNLKDTVTGETPGFRFPEQNSMISNAMTETGVPVPQEGTLEPVVNSIGSALAGTGGFVRGGQALASSANPIISGVGSNLAANPSIQAASAVSAEGSRQGSQAVGPIVEGTGPLQDLIATIVGGMAPGAAVNLARGTGIPIAKGGTDPVTGEQQPHIRIFGKTTDQVEQGRAFWKNLLPKGVNAAREAAGESRATSEVSQRLRQEASRSSGGISSALKNLENADEFRVGGFEPTSGTLSNNTGLQGLEKGVSTRPELVDRALRNNEAISRSADRSLPRTEAPGYGQTEDLQKTVKSGVDQKVNTAKTNLTKAEKEALDADVAAKSESDTLLGKGDSQARYDASRRASADVSDAEKASSAEMSELYAKIDPESPILFSNTRDALKKATADIGANEDSHPLITRMLSTRATDEQAMKDTGKVGTSEIPGGPIPTPFREAQSDLRAINKALREDPGNRQLMMVKQGILDDLDAAGGSNQALRDANEAYAKIHGPLYKSDASKKVLSGKADPAESLDTYFSGPKEAKQAAELVKKGDIKESDVRDYWISKMASKTITPGGITRFVYDNNGMLSHFPEIKREMERAAVSIRGKQDASNKMVQEVRARKAELKDAENFASTSDEGKLASSKSPETDIVRNILAPGGHKYMEKMVSEAKKDATGRAIEGLKNSVSKGLQERITNYGSTIKQSNNPDPVQSEDLAKSLAEFNKITKSGSDSRRALEQVYDAKEMEALDRVAKLISLESRRKNSATTGGSITAPLSEAAKAVDQAPNTAGTRSLKLVHWIMKLPERVGTKDLEAKKNRILIEAMTNPEKAAVLLRRESPQNVKALEKAYSGILGSVSNSEEED